MILNLDRIVGRLHGDGYTAHVENTGGGVMCLFAGTAVRNAWSACAGPGWTQAGGAHLADTADFYVGPDGDTDGLPMEAYRQPQTEDEAVEAIKAQVAETDTVRVAAFLLGRGQIEPEDVLLVLEAMV